MYIKDFLIITGQLLQKQYFEKLEAEMLDKKQNKNRQNAITENTLPNIYIKEYFENQNID